MEILSPAGNQDLIHSAVKEKSNAVYGGFKLWNARNNAINFTKEEYNEAISLLHKNNIKFYLTLNNLTLDSEIEDIINYLSQEDLIKPDAFIVADIGLLTKLKENFKNIPIHVSTQFGAHNLSDIRLLESLGVERVILARETTLDELNYIKKNTNLEIEIFVWGSQCLSFSGLCFFGSLINGGTGNRGKCINLCRDNYCTKENNGTLLYVSDMNCINLLSELENIDSLKIEGRRRPPKEIENVINEIKSRKSQNIQAGFLYGSNQIDNNMINIMNQRIKPLYKQDEMNEFNNYDVFVTVENNRIISFCKEPTEDSYYVYTELLKDYIIDKKNYSIELQIKSNVIEEISITNYKGENTIIKSDNKAVSKKNFDLEQFYEYIQKNIDKEFNIIKIKYIKDKNNNIYIKEDMVPKLLEYFSNQLDKKIIQKQIGYKNKINNIYLQTSDINVVDKFINEKNIKIIYELTSVSDLENIEDLISKYDQKIIFRMPIFNWKSVELTKYYNKLTNQEIMFTRYSQIYDSRNIKFKKKYTDYMVYSWNKKSLQFLLNNNIEEFTASPELSVDQNESIFKNQSLQYIVGGRPTLAYTRNCLKTIFNCDKCNQNNLNIKHIHNQSKNLKFLVSCKKDHREIYYSYPILNDYSKFKLLPNRSYRLLTFGFTLNQIEDFINCLNLENYYEIIKDKPEWKNSYECNLIEGRN